MRMSRRGRGEGNGAAGEELVAVAFGHDAIEAEMIKGLLEDAGIPSLLQPAGMSVDGSQLGFHFLPRFFGGGPQRVMVHAGRAEQARVLLAETLVEREEDWPETVDAEDLADSTGRKPRGYGLLGAYARIYFWSFGLMGAALGIFLLLRGV
jgi:hypothetical protein